MTEDERTSLYRLAYDEAVRALAGQQVLIESLRARAGLLLSAAAVTTSFLGAQALRIGNANPFIWIALVVFAGAAGVCLAVFWPRSWEFALGPREVIRTYLRSEVMPPLAEVYEDLTSSWAQCCRQQEGARTSEPTPASGGHPA